ncbi:hypothetical protein H5410_027565 [Solanum commersonii]|uniref:Uncharacterized protein n=1 Tax=Solanum commersonii TaxID=4109 RepID=A0A9J5YZI9_SOLCO|nr:hypothetical protein H5410_027565 [Solanum commersonii]
MYEKTSNLRERVPRGRDSDQAPTTTQNNIPHHQNKAHLTSEEGKETPNRAIHIKEGKEKSTQRVYGEGYGKQSRSKGKLPGRNRMNRITKISPPITAIQKKILALTS